MLARAFATVSGHEYGSVFYQKLHSLVSGPYKMVKNCVVLKWLRPGEDHFNRKIQIIG